MANYQYLFKSSQQTFVRPDGSTGTVSSQLFVDAIDEFDRIIALLEDVEIPIAEILGLRNLSAFIGETYNRAFKKISDGQIENNPHQDGYPDLLVMDELGLSEWARLKGRRREKEPFSPFLTGGLEVKATCGDIRTARWFGDKGLEKPDIGDGRLNFITGYNWKAHHRETNNLIGIIWDFIDRKPTIVCLTYSSKLTEEDWGKTVTPKAGGGRTTSVSIMNKEGVSKMFGGVMAAIDDDTYRTKMFGRLSKY